MKKLLFGTIVLALVSVFPITTMAGVDVSVGISIPLPPPVTFEAPPPVVAITRYRRCLRCSRCKRRHFFLEWFLVASVGRPLVSFTIL